MVPDQKLQLVGIWSGYRPLRSQFESLCNGRGRGSWRSSAATWTNALFVSICQVSRDDLKAPESRPPLMICSSAVLVQMASDLKPSRRSTSTLSVLQRALVFSRLEVSSKTLLQKIKAFSIDWYSRINQFFQGICAVGIRTTGRATIREIS